MDTPCHSSWCSRSCGAAVVVLVLAVLFLATFLPLPAQAHHTILTIDVPTATGAYGMTYFAAINDPGQILGHDVTTATTYLLTNPAAREAQQTRTTIACLGATFTYGSAINRVGEVVGMCDGSGPLAGFFLNRAGVYQILTYPVTNSSGTEATGINNRRQIVGIYEELGFWHGFRWERGQFTPFDVPFPEVTQTFPSAINYTGQIVGYYFGNDPQLAYGGTHGFWYHDGVFERLDVPLPNVTHTWIFAINDFGHMIGHFHAEDATTFVAADFVYFQGTFYATNLPAPSTVTTRLIGINNSFQLVGNRQVFDPANTADPWFDHGLLSTWDTREATPLLPAAAAPMLRSRPAVTPQDDCAALKASGVPLQGKLMGLALVCGH